MEQKAVNKTYTCCIIKHICVYCIVTNNNIMDLKELVNRQDSKPLSQEEAIFVIKQYIKIRKGADINPVIDMSIGFAPIISDQLIKLTKLTAIAISWLRSNKY